MYINSAGEGFQVALLLVSILLGINPNKFLNLVGKPLYMSHEILNSFLITSRSFSPDILGNLLGWIGTFSYLLAYLLLVLGVLKSKDKLYHLLNIIGAVGLILHSIKLLDWPNIIVNLVWALIAITALALIYKKRTLN